jgi:uncharacterized protein
MFKSAKCELKALGEPDGLEPGQFKALVSVFGNIDSTGDMVMPGAFAKTLAEWEASGSPIPILWSHRMDDQEFIVGQVAQAAETELGLEILGQLDVGDGTPKAKATYNALKSGRTTQFSFAYDVIDGGPVEKDGQSYNELRELKLYEVSPTPIGANQETELLAIKAATGLKLGRTISGKNEATLREAVSALEGAAQAIKSVLSSIDSGDAGDDEDGKAMQPSGTSVTGPAKDEEPSPAKSEEPIRRASVELWEAETNLTDLEGVRHAAY